VGLIIVSLRDATNEGRGREMMFGGQCSNKAIVWTRLLLCAGLLAFFERGWCILASPMQEDAQPDEVGNSETNNEESCAAAPTASHFLNLVVEPQFGVAGGSNNNQRCKDRDDRCATWSQAGECLKNPVFMLVTCMTSCRSCLPVTGRYGVEQVVLVSQPSDNVLEEYMVAQRMHEYMMDVVFQDDSLQNVKHTVSRTPG
jgi:hypothetical protein